MFFISTHPFPRRTKQASTVRSVFYWQIYLSVWDHNSSLQLLKYFFWTIIRVLCWAIPYVSSWDPAGVELSGIEMPINQKRLPTKDSPDFNIFHVSQGKELGKFICQRQIIIALLVLIIPWLTAFTPGKAEIGKFSTSGPLSQSGNMLHFSLCDCVPAGCLAVRDGLMLIDSQHQVSVKATVITLNMDWGVQYLMPWYT